VRGGASASVRADKRKQSGMAAAPPAVKGKSAAKPAKSAAKAPKGVKRGRSVAEAASTAAADDKGYVFINGRRVRLISTQGITIPKRPKNNGGVAAEPVQDTGPAKPLKTKLTAKQLNHYRELLLVKRSELAGDLSAIEAEALRSRGGEVSHMPIHMADIGTDTFDQDFMLGLAETERRQLREIDEALQRIEDGTYGVCHMTGKDIPKARLDAKPWAKYTIEAARLVENQWQR
jgi:DnaK suppressor protein